VIDGDDLALFERSLRHAVEQHAGPALDTALDELGWADALADDRRTAVATLFELQGAHTATSSALDHVVVAALGSSLEPGAAVVLPPIGRWAPPGVVDADGLQVSGLVASADPDPSSLVVVAVRDDKEIVLPVPVSAVEVRPVEGIDPDLGLRAVDGAAVDLSAEPEVVAGPWSAAVDVARLALAHELVGASRRMLALACEHALERVQFGQPISGFQAVRHRLAETLVAIELADAVLDAAWLDGSSDAAAMAKATAGRQAKLATRHCQQVLAGIGFTTEHPLHRSIRRVFALDGLLGTAATLTTALGRQVLDSRRLPPLLPL
jgi:hypothetical protein